MFQNGMFLIIPQLAALSVSLPLSYLADVLRRRKILSTIAVRKIFQSIGVLIYVNQQLLCKSSFFSPKTCLLLQTHHSTIPWNNDLWDPYLLLIEYLVKIVILRSTSSCFEPVKNQMFW